MGAGGGSSVKKATFNQFFSLHFVPPFLRAALAVGSCRTHDYLHQKGSPNPLGLSLNADKIPMHPYCLFKDLVTIFIFIPVLALFVYYMPNVLGQSDNYILSNPLQAPRSVSGSCHTIAKVTSSSEFTTQMYCSNDSNCQLFCLHCSLERICQ